jgi:hypothetical protein
MATPKWILHLLPRRGQSFRQHFVGVLLTWGVPVIIIEILSARVLRTPSALPLFLLLELPATLIGVLVFTFLEHLYTRGTRDEVPR